MSQKSQHQYTNGTYISYLSREAVGNLFLRGAKRQTKLWIRLKNSWSFWGGWRTCPSLTSYLPTKPLSYVQRFKGNRNMRGLRNPCLGPDTNYLPLPNCNTIGGIGCTRWHSHQEMICYLYILLDKQFLSMEWHHFLSPTHKNTAVNFHLWNH